VEIKVKTLTPIWTGDVERESTKLRETSIIGSLRWWFEAIVRGLGGYACDPNSNGKCELDPRKLKKSCESKSLQDALDEQICPVCQLFGCTNWARRFRLEINGINEKDIVKGKGSRAGLMKNKTFNFKVNLISELTNEQKWLIKKTLWVIENYGAVGGRTTWKPNGEWGTPYGIIKVQSYGDLANWDSLSDKDKVVNMLKRNKEKLKKDNNPNWFNFKFYWIIKGRYLTRSQINSLVRRNPDNPQKYSDTANNFDRWLGGGIGVSKKVFSFGDPAMTFGYVRNDDELKEIVKRIRELLGEVSIKTGAEILEGL